MLAVTGLERGGTERQVTGLALGLAERGADVAVASLFDRGPFMKELQTAGIDVFEPGFVRWRTDGLYAVRRNTAAMWQYARWMRSRRPEVVHSFFVHASIATVPLARALRVPAVVETRRNMGVYRAGRSLSARVTRAPGRLAHHVVANAQTVASFTERTEGLSRDRVSVIANGIAQCYFNAETAHLPSTRGPVVLCVANLRPVKGVAVLVEAILILHARGVPLTLVLIGDGPDRERINALAKGSGADIRLLGIRDDVPQWLARADLVVLPSLSEGASNSLLEAMAAGRPIVATYAGGNAEILGQAGVLVPPRNAAALAAAIGALLADPARRAELGAIARARAEESFSFDEVVTLYSKLYDRLLAPCAV